MEEEYLLKERPHSFIPSVKLKFKTEEECNKYITTYEGEDFDCGGYDIQFDDNNVVIKDVVKKN